MTNKPDTQPEGRGGAGVTMTDDLQARAREAAINRLNIHGRVFDYPGGEVGMRRDAVLAFATPRPAETGEVIQADRDAAAWLYTSGLINAGSADANDKTAAVIAAGEEDGRTTVQAFKNHRLAFASPTPEPSGAVVREALEGADYAAHLAIEKGIEQGAVHWRKGLELVQELCRTALASLDAGSASS